jgi:pimeloyl-[acyl-carrier protein] methyl ester esterase
MTNIHIEIFGEGKPIVMAHGWAMHSGIWRPFAQQLAHHYQVICVDLPGHGRSGPIGPFTLGRISDALYGEISSCLQTGACWLGWSLGASVVLDMADRHPEWVSSLVLLAGNPLFLNDGQGWPGMKAQLLDDFAGQLDSNCQATLLRFLSLQVNALPEQKKMLQS